MLEYAVAAGGVSGGGYGSSGVWHQLEGLSSDPVAWAIAAGLLLLLYKLVR